MKKILLLFPLIILILDGYACDICGCANGNSFFGVLPQAHRQFAGIRYRQISFDSHINSTLLQTSESFKTTELWARLYPLPKVQMLLFLPYHQNTQIRKSDNFQANRRGIGDIRVMLQYNFLNTFFDTSGTVAKNNHQLLAGIGLKAPTGEYRYNENDLSQVNNANFQLGTGSWDFPLSVIYTYSGEFMGMNINLIHGLNTSNSNGYRFANQNLLSVLAFKSFFIKNTNFLFSLGSNSEYRNKDVFNGTRNSFTGGWYVNASAGLDIYLHSFSIGFNGNLPIVQKLSNGELVLNQSFGLALSKMF